MFTYIKLNCELKIITTPIRTSVLVRMGYAMAITLSSLLKAINNKYI